MGHDQNVEAEVERNVRGLHAILDRTPSDRRPVALMMCGIAGSGKSTYAKAVTRLYLNFQRMSIDQTLANRRGIVGRDYPENRYHEYQDEADTEFLSLLRKALEDGTHDIVVDRSFYAKEDRDEYRELIHGYGWRTVLLHLKAPKDVLWQRICARRAQEVNADTALNITRTLLDQYYDGFEWPQGEGEIVIDTGATMEELEE